MATSYNKESPCLTCKRVRDPQNCEKKQCTEWQAWWLMKWEGTCAMNKAKVSRRTVKGKPISVGGTKYHHPDRVREFIEMDPCLQCPWSDGLCQGACETKKIWLKAKEESCELEDGSKREA